MDDIRAKYKNNSVFTSVRDAWRGLWYVLRTERNFRIEVAIASVIIPMAIVLPLSDGERAGIFFFVVLVLFAELVNTAIERTVDLLSPQYHETAGIAKDVVAAAVLVVGASAIAYTLVVACRVAERLM